MNTIKVNPNIIKLDCKELCCQLLRQHGKHQHINRIARENFFLWPRSLLPNEQYSVFQIFFSYMPFLLDCKAIRGNDSSIKTSLPNGSWDMPTKFLSVSLFLSNVRTLSLFSIVIVNQEKKDVQNEFVPASFALVSSKITSFRIYLPIKFLGMFFYYTRKKRRGERIHV